MRHLILFCTSLFLLAPAAFAQSADTDEQIQFLKDYCIPAVVNQADPAETAVEKKLKEFEPDMAKKFSPEGGRVFTLPDKFQNAVLIAGKDYCSIAVHRTDARAFWTSLDKNLGHGFMLMHERRIDEEKVTKREYSNDSQTLLVTASDTFRPQGIQALMTLALKTKAASP